MGSRPTDRQHISSQNSVLKRIWKAACERLDSRLRQMKRLLLVTGLLALIGSSASGVMLMFLDAPQDDPNLRSSPAVLRLIPRPPVY